MRIGATLSLWSALAASLACGGQSPSVLKFILDKDGQEERREPRAPSGDGLGDTAFDASELVRRTRSFPLFAVLETGEIELTQIDVVESHIGRQIGRATSSYPFIYAADKKTVQLISPVDPRTLSVRVDGTLLGSTAYAVDTTRSSLTFIDEPALGASVAVSYRLNTTLPTTVAVAGPSEYLGLTVFVEDQLIKDAVYDPDRGEVRFTAAPLDEARVRLDFIVAAEAVREYAHGLSGLATNHRVSAHYVVDGTPLEVETNGDLLTIIGADFRSGEKVRLDVIDEATIAESIAIDEFVEEGSLVVENAEDICASGSIVLLPSGVDLSECELEGANLLITLSYLTLE